MGFYSSKSHGVEEGAWGCSLPPPRSENIAEVKVHCRWNLSFEDIVLAHSFVLNCRGLNKQGVGIFKIR